MTTRGATVLLGVTAAAVCWIGEVQAALGLFLVRASLLVSVN